MGTTESHNLTAVSRALNPTQRFTQGSTAFLIYLAISLLFFGLPLAGHFSSYYLGRDADPPQMMWLLQWWPFAIRHHLNPFLTDYVWAPVGFNFAWMTSTPLAAILAAPLTNAVGLVRSLNILTILGAPTAAFSAFLLCKRVSRSFWPSMFGGFVFGFSSYMMGQTLGHLNLVLVFPIPLAAYLVVRWFEGSVRDSTFVAFLALTLIAEFLLDMEVLAAVFKRMHIAYELDDNVFRVAKSTPKAARRITTNVWPGFPSDLVSLLTVLATQCQGETLVHDWLYELRLFALEQLSGMGAGLFLCDPHRIIITGPKKLHGRPLDSRDLRSGMALIAAALAADGVSTIAPLETVERGYGRLVERLKALGASVEKQA